MKKPKISLDSAKLKGLFIQHVEKLLLVAIVGVMLFLVYQGFSMPGLEPNKTPKGLLQTSQTMLQFINDSNRWNEIKEERQITADVVGDAKSDKIPVDPNQYFLSVSWDKPNFPKLSPRTDPKLFPPIHLVVRPMIGSLAYSKTASYVDPLQPPPEEEGAIAPKPKPKAKPKAKRPPRPRGGVLDGLGNDPGLGMDDGMGMDPGLGMDPGMGMDAGMGMGMNQGPQGQINPEAILGFQATDAEAHNAQAMVVMAVVPFEKQFEEFQNALLNSLDYKAERDTPYYLQYYIQRIDVTDNPDTDPATFTDADWAKAPISVNVAKNEASYWAGALTEIVSAEYLDGKLTHPAPPFMQRDVWDLLTHPDIPLPALASTDTGPADGRSRPPVRPAEGGPTSDAPTLDDFGPRRGGLGMDDGMGAGMPGSGAPGAGRLGGGPAAVPPGGGRFGAGGMASGMGAAPPGMGMDDGMGMGGYGAGSGTAGLPPPKYKLIRFTDLTPERGRKYRYRMKVLLQDPNHPHTNYTPPSLASLDEKVRTRIRSLESSVYWVASEWSEPSPVAELPALDKYFAGTVKQPASTSNLVPGKPPVPSTTHPQGKGLMVVWDGAKVVDVPAEVEMHRGSILNVTQDVRVIHPVGHHVVELKEYAFSTNTIVADMIGGEEIPLLDKRSEKPPLTAPGEILFFDASGNLRVQNEADDIEGYRRYFVSEAPEPAADAPAGGDAAGGFGDILDGTPMPGTVGAPPGTGPARPPRR